MDRFIELLYLSVYIHPLPCFVALCSWSSRSSDIRHTRFICDVHSCIYIGPLSSPCVHASFLRPSLSSKLTLNILNRGFTLEFVMLRFVFLFITRSMISSIIFMFTESPKLIFSTWDIWRDRQTNKKTVSQNIQKSNWSNARYRRGWKVPKTAILRGRNGHTDGRTEG